MKTPALGGVVFDTAAVVSWAKQTNYAQAVVWATVGAGNTILVPATALAAARAHIPANRLDILDVLLGDPPLFPHQREVELSWEILDPITDFWESTGRPEAYAPGSWGPAGSDEMLARDGRRWRMP